MLQISEAIREERIHLDQAIDRHLRLHIAQINRTENFIGQQYQQTLTVVLLTSIAVIFLTLIVVFLMMRSVLKPVKRLQEGTRQIGKGNLSYQVTINSGDEFEFLAQEFGKMAKQLAGYHNEFDLKVQQRTRELLHANAELKELDELVNIDSLTRVANRRYFDKRLCQEWQQLADTGKGEQLAVIFVDMDYFKQYNDTYGHQAGDEALRQLVTCFSREIREVDRLYRYGGEELLLLMHHTDRAQAEQVVERLRQALTEQRIPHSGSHLGILTVSAGISSLVPGADAGLNSLLASADRCLYRAKREGRNRWHGCALSAAA